MIWLNGFVCGTTLGGIVCVITASWCYRVVIRMKTSCDLRVQNLDKLVETQFRRQYELINKIDTLEQMMVPAE